MEEEDKLVEEEENDQISELGQQMNLENDRYRFNRMHSLANKIKGVSGNTGLRSKSNSSRGGSSRGSGDSGTRRSKNSEGV